MQRKMTKIVCFLHIFILGTFAAQDLKGMVLSDHNEESSDLGSGNSNVHVLAVGNDAKKSSVKYSLSTQELVSIHEYAKNVSHSKGLFVDPESSGDDLKLRRSVIRKASISSESEILKELLESFKSNTGDKLALLSGMAYLVHQYDVAINFANLGGIELLIPLLSSPDEDYASSAANVLGVAMQGNPFVQRRAVKLNVGLYLVPLLYHESPVFVSRILFTMSTYLRNMPQAQEEFLDVDGMYVLTRILRNYMIATNTKLKVINLLGDLAMEHQSYSPENEDYQTVQVIHKSLSDQMLRYGICQYIPSLLELEDLDSHQKVTHAMNSLKVICFKNFRTEEVFKRVRELLKLYDPLSRDQNPLYPVIDVELKQMMYDDLKTLYSAIAVESINKTGMYPSYKEKSEL